MAAAVAAAVPVSPAHARAGDGTIANFAGTPGNAGFAGDGGPAGQALLNTPRDEAFTAGGNLVIADELNDRVRRVTNGTMFTDAGGGSCGGPPCGDSGPASAAELNHPRGVTSMPDGGYLIADTLDNRIRRVFPDGHIATVAGNGTQGLGGDGGPATAAKLALPSDTAVLPDGSFLIADTGNHRLRLVAANGMITTVAGTTQGFSGDGGPATAAQLNAPRDVAVATNGGFVIADTGNDRVRRVDPAGTITTLAGTGPGLSGDGDPATQAQLRQPFSVAALPNGGVLVADTSNNRVRRITPLGAIIAVAGSTQGDSGNGGPAKGAQLAQPTGVTLAPGGGFLVSDTANAAIRRITDVGAVPPAVLQHSLFVEPGGGSVMVQPSGTSTFLPLREEDIVPNGSQVDATNGVLGLTVARDATGAQISTQVFSGPFTMRQLSGARPVTDFRLTPLDGCPRPKRTARATRATGAPLASVARRRRRRRRLWVSDSGGRWRTSTGSVTASSIGTKWLTTLRCDGTLISVHAGRVRVFDKVRKRTRILRKGQTYLARNRRSAIPGT